MISNSPWSVLLIMPVNSRYTIALVHLIIGIIMHQMPKLSPSPTLRRLNLMSRWTWRLTTLRHNYDILTKDCHLVQRTRCGSIIAYLHFGRVTMMGCIAGPTASCHWTPRSSSSCKESESPGDGNPFFTSHTYSILYATVNIFYSLSLPYNATPFPLHI